MRTKPPGPKAKSPEEKAHKIKTNPLAGYVTLFYHLQKPRSQVELMVLIDMELEGKRREDLLRMLVTRLFQLKKDEYLKSIGVNPNA